MLRVGTSTRRTPLQSLGLASYPILSRPAFTFASRFFPPLCALNPHVVCQLRHLSFTKTSLQQPRRLGVGYTYIRREPQPGMFNYENFEALDFLDKDVQKGLRYRTKFSETSQLQSAVLRLWPINEDMFVASEPGTGKSLALVLSAIEKTLDNPQGSALKSISTLIVTSNRDRAGQLMEDGKLIMTHHIKGVHGLIGGESRLRQARLLYSSNTDIVVGTPGRLVDMLQAEREFQYQCEGIKLLVLDCAEWLTKFGVREDLEDFLDLLPARDYQVWVFSRRSDPVIREFVRSFLKPNYIDMDLLDYDRYPVPNSSIIRQHTIVTPWRNQPALLHQLIVDRQKSAPAKIMVFLPTDSLAALYGRLLELILPKTIVTLSIHGKKEIYARQEIARFFRETQEACVLVTSDMEGWEIGRNNEVDMIVHAGPPPRREDYGDRVTRLRAKKGDSVMVIAPDHEVYIKRVMGEVGMKRQRVEEKDMVVYEGLTRVIDEARRKLTELELEDAFCSFAKFLGVNLPHLRLERDQILPAAKEFIESIGSFPAPVLSQSEIKNWNLEHQDLGPYKRTFPKSERSSLVVESREWAERKPPRRDSYDKGDEEDKHTKWGGPNDPRQRWRDIGDQPNRDQDDGARYYERERIDLRERRDNGDGGRYGGLEREVWRSGDSSARDSKDPKEDDPHDPRIRLPVSNRKWNLLPIDLTRPAEDVNELKSPRDVTLSDWGRARQKYGPTAILRKTPHGKIFNQNKERLEGGIWEVRTWDGGRLKKKRTLENTPCSVCNRIGHWARDCPDSL